MPGINGSAVALDGNGASGPSVSPPELTGLFHRLNNQLGIILANAELLESRLTEETERGRAGQVVSGALDAITTIQDLRRLVGGRHGMERPGH
jgi:hypothetical protein